FSGHGHEVHSPFDNHDSKSTSDFSGSVDGGFTVYQLHRTGSEIHPADGYDGPQGGGYPEPQGARDIYSYHIKGTSTKTKINTVPQAPFSDRWLKENAGAASGFLSRADEAGKLIWENDPDKNWRANRMDDIRGIVQGAVNPFLTGFQGLGVGAITDSAVNPVTYAAARKTLQGIHNLGNLSPEAQLAAASLLQDSAFAVKDGINSARQWADAHPNITATAQTALAVAEAAGTVWGGKKVELNPAKWDWVKNTGYKTPAVRTMHTLDGEMAGGNRPPKSITSNSKADASTQPSLQAQLIGEQISSGHAYNKHVIRQQEFMDLNINSPADFARHIENIVSHPTNMKELPRGRTAYWDDKTGTIVIRDKNSDDGGTAFRPTSGKKYYDDL
ncbi:TPA: polymorphic toxin MafB class 3, partial [Neisseria gonorrhoeae]